MDNELMRFTKAHQEYYEQALTEIRNGRNSTHWMWFIFPQLKELGHSSNALYYGIKDLNEAKAEAREDAVSFYPVEDVSQIFFVYKKNRKKFDVLCYALVKGESASAARNNPRQYSKKDYGMDESISKMKEQQAVKEAKQAEKNAKAEAKKEAKKAAKKDKAKAEKAAKKAADETYKSEMKKSGY